MHPLKDEEHRHPYPGACRIRPGSAISAELGSEVLFHPLESHSSFQEDRQKCPPNNQASRNPRPEKKGAPAGLVGVQVYLGDCE